MRSKSRLVPRLLGLAGVTLALGLLWWTFHEVDGRAVAALLVSQSVWVLPVIALPQVLSLSVESAGWRSAFRTMGVRTPFLSLLSVRLSTEALSQSLPLGPIWCETAKPHLLHERCGIALGYCFAGLAARKYLILVSQALYLVLAAMLSLPWLRKASPAILGGSGLEYLPLGAALALLLIASAFAWSLHRGAVGARLHGLLARVPLARFRRFVSRHERRFGETDDALARFFGGDRHGPKVLLFLAGWCLETVETYLILRFLGVHIDIRAVAGFEALVALLRHVFFIMPAGLGVQDLGYVTVLRALGVSDALSTGASFVLLKRSKELLWIAVGYALLVLHRQRATPSLSKQVEVA